MIGTCSYGKVGAEGSAIMTCLTVGFASLALRARTWGSCDGCVVRVDVGWEYNMRVGGRWKTKEMGLDITKVLHIRAWFVCCWMFNPRCAA